MPVLFSALTFSPSITIPLTHDCPWHCRYCGYRTDKNGLISEAEIDRLLDLATCENATEVLLMAGEIPIVLPHIREELVQRGFVDFIDFAVSVGRRCLSRGLLPHTNIGALSESQLLRLREVNASMGLMLENLDDSFNQTIAPEKCAAGRLKTIAAAGRCRIPYTSGILIGLGESHASRRQSLAALATLHAKYGHLQEIILQNYTPNAGSDWPTQRIGLQEYRDLIAHWRALAPDVAIQIPPNLNPYWKMLLPEIDDLGGISAEGDLINPENPWAQLEIYRSAAQDAGRKLQSRLPVYPRYFSATWLSDSVRSALQTNHSHLFSKTKKPFSSAKPFWDLPAVELQLAANARNEEIHGSTVTYVVNRNANFTNICNVGCAFCGFQRKAGDADAYTRSPEEVVARLALSPDITEVCIQGGINPRLGFDYYLDLLTMIKAWRPEIHIHAFSPMEIESLHLKTGWTYEKILSLLRETGLGSIPGTAAEILVDTVRQKISSRKLGAESWQTIVRAAHRIGLRSSATIMYGHVETWDQIRTHFDLLRRIQEDTGGFTELVPLQFIPHENPLGHRIRPNPEEVRLKRERLYPLARLFFGNLIPHLQTSWVKLGVPAAIETLRWGCDDFGGTLGEESITRASGGPHGETLTVAEILAALRQAGRQPQERTTLYAPVVRPFPTG